MCLPIDGVHNGSRAGSSCSATPSTCCMCPSVLEKARLQLCLHSFTFCPDTSSLGAIVQSGENVTAEVGNSRPAQNAYIRPANQFAFYPDSTYTQVASSPSILAGRYLSSPVMSWAYVQAELVQAIYHALSGVSRDLASVTRGAKDLWPLLYGGLWGYLGVGAGGRYVCCSVSMIPVGGWKRIKRS